MARYDRGGDRLWMAWVGSTLAIGGWFASNFEVVAIPSFFVAITGGITFLVWATRMME